MNKNLFYLALVGSLLACKKETKIPSTAAPAATVRVAARIEDTLPDQASFKLGFAKDNHVLDETMLIFDHNTNGRYKSSDDAVYFPGFGVGSLASISVDSIACAIQVIPYHKNAATRLKMGAKNNGIYTLSLTSISRFPAGIHLWLQDACRKDSMDLRVGNYAFYVNKADSTTFGSNRFRIVLN